MDDFLENPEDVLAAEEEERRRYSTYYKTIEGMLKENRPLDEIADDIISGTFEDFDIQKKDSIDKFLDFVFLKVKTGVPHIISLAYPAMRITDSQLEDKIEKLINLYLHPEIIFTLLKFFTRNIHNSDTNLYLANLITSEDIIRSLFDTFALFKADIAIVDPNRRTLNVKRLQQFHPGTDNRFSSPLDAAARFKYILEFISLKQNTGHIFTRDNLQLTGPGRG